MDRASLLHAYSQGNRDLRGLDLAHADLNGVDLSGADLSGSTLAEAKLAGARLLGVRLVGGDLRGAFLRESQLSGANLFGADLVGAQLAGGSLRGANLQSANLGGTDCSQADLRDADLRDANARANFAGAQLDGAKCIDWQKDKLIAGSACLDGVHWSSQFAFCQSRLAPVTALEALAEHLTADPHQLASASQSEDGWESSLLFPRFQTWMSDLVGMSGRIAVRASYAAAVTTLRYANEEEARNPDWSPMHLCSPAYKLEGIAKHLHAPSEATLHRLAELHDYTAQLFYFHEEFDPWFGPNGEATSQSAWAETAAEYCLRTLLCEVMGPRHHEPRRCFINAYYCALASLNAHRASQSASVAPAIAEMISSIRDETTSAKLEIELSPSTAEHRSIAW